MNEKVVEREGEEKKNAMQQTVKRVTVRKRYEESIIKEHRDPMNYTENENSGKRRAKISENR